ncbi:hypothetical protein [uncultured Psychroserpens sp.]|uniref:hypothetical protein n=1 Tax=uncultured Psychroserpens sp. TaxID=255436 RepID=UPI0026397B43|nr:hypothetical protein [uncultured Psychroserpens sp.]
MKKVFIISSLLIIGFLNPLEAQFTQVELFTGFDKTDFTLFSSYPINKSKTLSLNTLAFFQKFKEEKQEFDEIGVQPTFFWNITKNIAIGTSIYYNSFAGYSERLSAKYTFKSSRLLLVLIPTVAHSDKIDASYAEVFIQFQYNKPLNDNLSLWLNGQFLTIWDEFKIHSRSFQQLRVGMSFYDHQLGIGLDIDQYGLKPIEKSALGFYYRKTL